MKTREVSGRCANGIRHWFTCYGDVGARRANCGHCRQPHESIRQALERGLSYVRLYEPPEEDEGPAARDKQRAIDLITQAIERVANEHREAHRRR